jgi:hypothetical protein
MTTEEEQAIGKQQPRDGYQEEDLKGGSGKQRKYERKEIRQSYSYHR